MILRITDGAMQERKRAQDQQELLIAELNHRVRNILNLIRGLVNQSQHDAGNPGDFARIVGGRIGALAAAHDNITRENWSPASLEELVTQEAHAYLGEKQSRLSIDGDDVLLAPEAYTVLALVIHEMMTNSAKYGSLSDRHGQLVISLTRDEREDLVIGWKESGGPAVKPPQRRGFGSTIIERSIPFELKGEASIDYDLTGVTARFVVPASYVKGAPEGADAAQVARTKADEAATPGVLPERVLIVEDSMIIALDTEDILLGMGVKHVEIAGSVAQAMNAIASEKPDFALLDYNLGSESSDPVARRLAECNVPFVLATGYGDMADKFDRLGAAAVLKKPYDKSDIQRALAAGMRAD